MSDTNYIARLDVSLRLLSKSQKNFVRSAIVLSLAMSIVSLIYDYRRVVDIIETSPWSVSLNESLFQTKLRIALALVVSAISIWPFRAKWYLISTGAVVWIELEYAVWIKDSFGIKAYYDHERIKGLPEPSIAPLYGANWFDILSGVLATMFFIWVIKTFTSAFRASRINDLKTNQ
jgi:hypothetical protein